MNNIGKKIGILLGMCLLLVTFMTAAYATVTFPVDVYKSYYTDTGSLINTNNPVTQVNAIGFICNDPQCTTLGTKFIPGVSSANTNRLTFTLPTNAQFPNGGAYGLYLYNENYIGWEISTTYAGTGTAPVARAQLTQIDTCRIEIDTFEVTNDVYPNQPIMVDISASLDSTVTSPINNAGVLDSIPNEIKRTYQVGARVNLEITNENGVIVNTQATPILLDFSGEKRVEFSYTPTQTGRYTAKVITTATDGKCSSSEPHTATETFSVIPQGPIEQCYVLLDNLDASAQNVYVGDDVDFTVEKIANYYDSDGNLHTLPATLYVDARTNTLGSTFELTLSEFNNQPSSYSSDDDRINVTTVRVNNVEVGLEESLKVLPGDKIDFSYVLSSDVTDNTVEVRTRILGLPSPVFDVETVTLSQGETKEVTTSVRIPLALEDISYSIVTNVEGRVTDYAGVGFELTYIGETNERRVVSRQTIQTSANPNVVDPVIVPFTYVPQSEGYHIVGVTADVPNCPYSTVTTDAVDVTVYAVNKPIGNTAPVISGLPDKEVFKNSGVNQNLFDLDNFATDAENDALTFTITSESRTDRVDCSIDANNNIDCTAKPNMLGCSAITVSVTDGQASDSDSFNVCVVEDPNANTAPTLSAVGPFTVYENSGLNNNLVDLDTKASDAENDVLTFAITAQSRSDIVSCILDSQNNLDCTTVSGLGCSTVGLSVTDGEFTATQNTQVCVVEDPNANTAPVISGLPNKEIFKNSGVNQNLFDLDNFATDAENDVLTFTITSESRSDIVDCAIDANNNIDCTAKANMLGCSLVSVSVTDGEFSDSDSFTVCVVEDPNANTAPVLTGLPDKTLFENSGFNGNLFDLDNFATDAENDVLTFTITSESRSDIVDCGIDANNNVDCIVRANKLGCSLVTATVRDGEFSDSDSFTVCVVEDPNANTAPTLSTVGPFTVYENSGLNNNLVDLDTKASDAENDVLTFTITAQSRSDIVSCTLDSQNNLDCTTVSGLGCSTVGLSVTDGEFTATQNTQVCVERDFGNNHAPNWDSIPTEYVYQNSGVNNNIVNIANFVSDAENDPFTISLISQSRTDIVSCSLDSASNLDCVEKGVLGCSVITFSADDGYDVSNQSMNVCVIEDPNANKAPVLANLPDQTLFENSGFNGNLFDLDNFASDANGDLLSYVIVSESNPSVVTCSINSTGAFSCTTVPNQLGCSVVTVSATDGEFSVSKSLNVCVVEDPNANKPPVANFTSVIMQEDEDARVVATLANNISDPDGDALTLSLVSQSQPNIVICSLAANTDLICEPQTSHYGTSILTFSISDGMHTVVETLTVVVERNISDFKSTLNVQPDFIEDSLFINQFKVLNDDCFQTSYACEEIVLLLDIRNYGDVDQEGVRVAVSSFDLGVRRTLGPFDLDKGDQFARELIIPTFGQIEPGYHTIRLVITAEDGLQRIVHRDIYLRE